MPYPWYSSVEGGQALEQGDILLRCRVPVVPADQPELIDAKEQPRVVILTQSCDLQQFGIANVLVCPAIDFNQWAAATGKSPGGVFEELRKGRRPRHMLLNPYEGTFEDHLVVDFGGAFSIPLSYALELAAAGRTRLLPPYREHLAQGFARFYMRVGLPVEVVNRKEER